MWILLKQETVSGIGISWAICKSAPRSRQITMPTPTTQLFTGRMPFLPPNQQCQSTEGKTLKAIIDIKIDFYVFYFPNVFYIKKTLAKFRAASRLTRSTSKITATK